MNRMGKSVAMAALAGMAMMNAPLRREPPTPQPEPEPEVAQKRARRVAAKMTNRKMRQRFGAAMPALDNHAAKLMGLPHQGSREMVRRAKRMADPSPDCTHGGKHGPWTTTYMGASCDTCGYFTQD